jgi:hypothetical protein
VRNPTIFPQENPIRGGKPPERTLLSRRFMTASLALLILTEIVSAVPAPTSGGPAVTSVLDAPAPRSSVASPNPYDNALVPAFQLIGAEAIVALSFVAADKTGDWGTALALATPATVSLSTCGIGAMSRHYRGSCWHSLAGAGLGILSGATLYLLFEAIPSLNPLSPGQDDTQAFVNQIATLIYVAVIGIPVGSVVGWNVGKVALPDSTVGDALPQLPPPAALPLSSLTFRGEPAGRLIVPLLAGTF